MTLHMEQIPQPFTWNKRLRRIFGASKKSKHQCDVNDPYSQLITLVIEELMIIKLFPLALCYCARVFPYEEIIKNIASRRKTLRNDAFN